MRWLTFPTLIVLAAATASQIALAAGATGYTGARTPPSWASTAVLGACLAMAVAGSVIAWVVMLDAAVVLEGAAARLASLWSTSLIPCVAAAAVLARWFTPDPYYLPSTFRRLSEGGIVSAQEIAAVVLLAAASGIAMRIRPGPGLFLCAGSLWLSALVMLVEGLGH
jgi:hypothetical protein